MAEFYDYEDAALVVERLQDRIRSLTLNQQRNLLHYLEKITKPNRRQHERRSYTMAVDYVIKGRSYTDFIHNISGGGAFIGTREHFAEGDDIAMSFMLPTSRDAIKFNGRVVRAAGSGIGVLFTS